jgi:hypothetical protein
MKPYKLLFFILFTVTSFTACAQTRVHYTQTGKKYHTAYCKHLRKSDYTCTLEEAKKKGLEPCSQCNPPIEEKKKKIKRKKTT